ncbi:MAG: hypothetical protein HC837_04940 [Chloroflexaceae bacterium]|nr:hypothetical protein [Chloroflexaceae bacterium]
MKQHATLILSVLITVFLLVLIGGVTTSLMSSNTAPTNQPTTPAASGSATSETPANDTPTLTPGEVEATISAERAALIALDAAVGSRLMQDPELVNFAGTVAYEVNLDQGMVYVHAQAGAILENQSNSSAATPTSGQQISQAQAIEKARTYAGGGTVKEAELEQEHGTLAYAVEFTDGSEVYIDAVSGEVLYAELQSSRLREDTEPEEYERHDDEYEDHDEDHDNEREHER